MLSVSKKTRLILSLIHLALGLLLLSGFFTKIYSLLIFGLGVLFIIKSKNKHNEAVYWSAYIIGAEVVFRMSGGMVFYELPKYSVLLFLALGLFVEAKKHHISISYLIYILLLLVGIAFVDIPFNEPIRNAIAFNLSGPILLGISAIYFYKRKFQLTEILNVSFFMLLPIISMIALLYLKTPDLQEIQFSSGSNFEASGGYGPNQVATILGIGVFIVVVHLFFSRRIFQLFFIDIILFSYLIFRGLITLSRGGMVTALFAIAAFTFFFILARNDKLKIIVKYSGLVVLFGVVLFVYTSNVTGGMLENRYTNKNSIGVKKQDVSTGRLELFKAEIGAFLENPFFGIGVGGVKYYRAEQLNKMAATHNEMSRLIGEHGLMGVLALLILLITPTVHILKQSFLARAFLSAFLIFWFLTINHSAMRIAFPAFIYGLSVCVIIPKKELDEE
jgi:O-antigen ligase